MATTAFAQPLVTGNLTYYFPFDDGDLTVVGTGEGGTAYGVLSDRSGNGFDGDVYIPDPNLSMGVGAFEIDTTTFFRGNGSGKLVQSNFPVDDGAVFVNLRGEVLTANHFDKIPAATDAATYAAWINTTSNDLTDQSIFQGRAEGRPGGGLGNGTPHFQLQRDGRLRVAMRTERGDTVFDARAYIDGTTDSGLRFPVGEWFHYAATYDRAEDTWVMYYNGVAIQSGASQPGTDGKLGSWAGQTPESANPGTDMFSAGFGSIYDIPARLFDGNLDELYVFNRALNATEIGILYSGVPEPSSVLLATMGASATITSVRRRRR